VLAIGQINSCPEFEEEAFNDAFKTVYGPPECPAATLEELVELGRRISPRVNLASNPTLEMVIIDEENKTRKNLERKLDHLEDLIYTHVLANTDHEPDEDDLVLDEDDLDGNHEQEIPIEMAIIPKDKFLMGSPEMVVIPESTFLMGSPEDEPERDGDEGPLHEVTVSPFFMSKYPITQSQWRFVAQLPQINRALDPEPSSFKGDVRPVEQVSWHDAVEFCDRLSAYTKRTYRLPTEAEWEYACRAGTTTPFHTGETITTELANYDGTFTYGQPAKGVYRNETTDVESFPPNAFGLFDMHGNVWEWCLDHWHENYDNAPTDGSAWLTDDENAAHVIRGGSWMYFARCCRSASRGRDDPDFRGRNLGFRVVCVLSDRTICLT
jgi:formylglycine-generating enzyme required for sulfatase activity